MSDAKEKLEEISRTRETMEMVRKLAREKAKTNEVKVLLKESEAQVVQLEEALAIYERLQEKDTQPIVIKPKKKRGAKAPHTFIALASDWHCCEKVTSSETGGRNEHNIEIGAERSERYWQALAALVKEQQARFSIDNIVLWLGGDFMVGEIHGVESARSSDLPPLDEIAHIKKILISGIDYLLNEVDVPSLHIVCSPGNHGRTTDRTRFRLSWAYSYEAYMYKELAAHYKSSRRVDFDVSDEHYKVVDVAGFRVLLHHGDNIRFAGGVGGLIVPFRRKSLQLSSTFNHDLYCIGHFHTYGAYSGTGFTNGSLVGWGSYAAGMGLPFEPPSQVTALIDHERRAVGRVMPIWV